ACRGRLPLGVGVDGLLPGPTEARTIFAHVTLPGARLLSLRGGRRCGRPLGRSDPATLSRRGGCRRRRSLPGAPPGRSCSAAGRSALPPAPPPPCFGRP